MSGLVRAMGGMLRTFESFEAKYDIFIDALLSDAPKACLSVKPYKLVLMTRITRKSTFLLFAAAMIVVSTGLGFGQANRMPLLQDIQLPQQTYSGVPAATPLVQKTGSVTPTLSSVSTIKTQYAALANIVIPGYSGVLVESLDGKQVLESNATGAFNPASNVKVATAYAVLKTFGPEFRFPTNVYTDGAIDQTTGTLNGNLYVSGRDPVFGFEHGVAIANELNKLGIHSIHGDLIVTDNFAMNYSSSAARSGETLFADLDASKRSPAATRVWLNYLTNSGQTGRVGGIPGVTFTGALYVQGIPSNLNLLFTHESAPLRDIIKATLCYSNNFMAERLGDMLGGPYAVARIVQLNAGVQPQEFSIQTASGLGINRVTPNAMMKLLRALRGDLARNKMTFADIMPVAGIDDGTLEGRFAVDSSRGSVVGKTGTLGHTDSGVSALSGEINTREGKFLFVIFNEHGSVARFRAFQNYFVSLVQGQLGGAVPILYNPVSLDARLAHSRFSYPTSNYRGNE